MASPVAAPPAALAPGLHSPSSPLSQPTLNLNDLPADVLAYTLCFLPTRLADDGSEVHAAAHRRLQLRRDVVQLRSVSLTSRCWRDLAKEGVVWEAFYRARWADAPHATFKASLQQLISPGDSRGRRANNAAAADARGFGPVTGSPALDRAAAGAETPAPPPAQAEGAPETLLEEFGWRRAFLLRAVGEVAKVKLSKPHNWKKALHAAGASQGGDGEYTGSSRRSVAVAGAPKNPLTSYFCYLRRTQRDAEKAAAAAAAAGAETGAAKESAKEKSRRWGASWQAFTEEEKLPYIEAAACEKARFDTQKGLFALTRGKKSEWWSLMAN